MASQGSRAAGSGVWSLLAAGAAFLLPVAYSPSVHATFWSPKTAILLVAGTAGLTRIPLLLRSPLRRVTIVALAFLAIAAISTIVSPRPVEAVFGIYNWGTGLVFVACLVGVWALGAASTDTRLLVNGFIAGCAASAFVALLQTGVTLPFAVLEDEGRATGLSGNPVHLGTVAAIGLALCAWRADQKRAFLVGVVAFAATVQVSATRTSLVVAIITIVVIGVRHAPRLLPHLVAAATVGFILGTVLASSADFTTASQRTADERALAAGSGSTIRVRVDVWLYARHAVIDHPVFGAGPGRFRAATSADQTRSVAEVEGLLYADGHNLFVEYTVTTGLLGVAALVGWLVMGLRAASGPLFAAALVALGCALVQPQSAGTTPLLFLAVGGAAAVPLAAPSRRVVVATPIVIGAGVVAALALVVGDVSLQRARDTFTLADARRANTLLRPWPEPAAIRSRIHEFRAIDADDADARRRERAEVRRWLLVAVRRDPTQPALWLALAGEERADGLDEQADLHEREALEHDPFALGFN